MREISARVISDTVRHLLLDANYVIGEDISRAVDAAYATEPSPGGREALRQIRENYRIAREERVAICQDTGMAVVFLDIGQDARITGGPLSEAVDQGVRSAYSDGYLRKSVVRDPLFHRANTGDNTPAVLHTRVVPGEQIHILVAPKGFGSENMSSVRMLAPSDGEAGLRRFVLETVEKAGPNPCPPVIVGIGIGGTMEQAAIGAKRMTACPVDQRHPDPDYAALEQSLLRDINRLGIGPAGIGGRHTALSVNIAVFPTHIAALPVAINLCCHCARHAEATI